MFGLIKCRNCSEHQQAFNKPCKDPVSAPTCPVAYVQALRGEAQGATYTDSRTTSEDSLMFQSFLVVSDLCGNMLFRGKRAWSIDEKSATKQQTTSRTRAGSSRLKKAKLTGCHKQEKRQHGQQWNNKKSRGWYNRWCRKTTMFNNVNRTHTHKWDVRWVQEAIQTIHALMYCKYP